MQISFYELTSTTLEKTLPKLLEKAYEGGLKAVICVESQERLKSIDSAMWTYSTMGFLPHGSDKDPKELQQHQPIWLTTETENPIGATLLVITNQIYHNIFKKYERVIDIYNNNEQGATNRAKERIHKYQTMGYEVVFWKQNLKGAWEKSNL